MARHFRHFLRLLSIALGLGASREAWLYAREATAARAPRLGLIVRGAQPRESQELMDQLADDMDELMRALDKPSDAENSAVDTDLSRWPDLPEFPSDEEEEEEKEEEEEEDQLKVEGEALMTLDTEAAARLQRLDFSGLERQGDHYLVTQQQMQSLVSAKVEQYQKIAKTFQRYIGELEEELDKVYEELDEKDEALTAETQRRETVELELENLHAQRAEMEQQLANAQQVTRDASSLLTHLDNEADQLTAKVISGEISEEQSNAMEEELIRAQAKKLAATKMEERWGQQLTEVNRATEEATARAREAEERQRLLSEELAVLQESLRKAEEERDREQQSRESAEGKFNELVRRLQERVGSRQM